MTEKKKTKKQTGIAKVVETAVPIGMTPRRGENTQRAQDLGEAQKSELGASCKDIDCPSHGALKSHGKIFQGIVVRKFSKRITIEFERSTYVRKYERFASHKTKIHARLPKCMEDKIQIGDYIKVQECRPLSKIIHFVVIGKVEKTEGGSIIK